MAVKPANSRYHTFTFNGVRAADYGIYVTDVNVFNSAARDVEYIEIPGRDGAFALDRGRFQNISVVYKCAMAQDTDEDFATAISEFRNAIASTKGYKRLEDDIHTNEYRMGVFSKGLEAPTLNTKTATFDVEFNCQPQRFLKSGETEISVSNGSTITNPTPFDAKPLIACDVTGDGYINIGDQEITFRPAPLGTLTLTNATNWGIMLDSYGFDIMFSNQPYNTGDTITLAAPFEVTMEVLFPEYISYTNSHTTGGLDLYSSMQSTENSYVGYYKNTTPITFIAGTASTKTMTISIDLRHRDEPGGSVLTSTVSCTIEVVYSGAKRVRVQVTNTSANDSIYTTYTTIKTKDVTVNSSASSFSGRVYVDADLGEAYTIDDTAVASVNSFVSMGSEPPVLPAGATLITFGDVTNVKITPRWWQI